MAVLSATAETVKSAVSATETDTTEETTSLRETVMVSSLSSCAVSGGETVGSVQASRAASMRHYRPLDGSV